jgi:hypothetical protein
MSNTPIIPPDAIRFNLARGLQSLADQAAAKFAAKLPGAHTAFRAAADVVKQAIRDNPDIPDKELTAVDIARDMGILKRPKRRRNA